ncbi:hypothetical protein [Halorussus litoreus]|uniref:hypothetical protein n=1 Tax=Halorussus litoreus TaxID=1710536 RepID=UPI000E241533|nr:hypothetical protein [Halorussus litoreus]
MSALTRRRALQLCSVALAGGTAGCATSSRNSSVDPTLSELDANNYDFRSYTVSVLVLDGDEPVYSAEKEIGPAEPEESDSSEVARTGGARFEGFPTDVGDYVLYAWRDDQPTSEWAAFDFREWDTPCLGLNIQIGDVTGSQTGEVSIWYTKDPDRCPAETTTASE